MPNRRFHTVQLVAAVLFALVSLRSIAEAKLQTIEGYKNIYGVRLFYKVIGQGDTILILHGGPGLDHSYMLPQMAELAKTHTLIFFDHRGFGRSDFRLDSAQYQLVNFIDDIEEMRKAFGLQKINLLGHSYGAQLAIHYTLRYPANVRSLILMSPASFNTRYTEAAAELQKKRFTREDSITRVKILASELYKHKDRQAYEQLYRNLFRSSFYNRAMADSLTLTLPYDFDERIAKLHYTYRHEWFYNFTTKLNEIPVQTLILYGDSDQLPQEAYAEMAKRIPHNTAIKLSHCGHFPFIEAKDSLFSAIRTFLKKVN